MRAYYNDTDSYCCNWLQNLMDAGHITSGKIDDRSIEDVSPDDVCGYERVHFFAGIAGWELALQLAGWGDRPVWTGSCPCQPLSSAGQRKGHVDERHLWPAFHRLIAECRPATIFGEQVASKDGREWFSAVRADLERLGYACGGADMPAAGVGAPHRRQRLWWVGHAHETREDEWPSGGEQSAHQPNNGEASRDVPAEANWRIGADSLAEAYAVPRRLDQIGAYGNAIVPPLAAEFVAAFMECMDDAA